MISNKMKHYLVTAALTSALAISSGCGKQSSSSHQSIDGIIAHVQADINQQNYEGAISKLESLPHEKLLSNESIRNSIYQVIPVLLVLKPLSSSISSRTLKNL